MSKKFFRPPPREEESDDDDDDFADDTNNNNNTVNANLSDSDDSSDEEEDDDDEEESNQNKRGNSQTKGPPKKKQRGGASAFFDMEADDDDESEGDGAGDGEDMDEETRELIRQQDRRRAQLGQFGRHSKDEEIAKNIENRHRMQRRRVDTGRIMDRAVPPQQQRQQELEAPSANYTAAVAQQSLLPSVQDPSLWMVSCATGKEQELVFQIMNKAMVKARSGKPLGISGAIAASSKGKLFIESFSEPAVVEAIQGVRGILQYTMKLVPISDMTTVMTVQSKKKPVKKGEWVRMTRGHYKGDLALVKAVKESGLKCVVQCLPRLDLTLSELPPEEARIRRRTVRPPQKFFNPQEVNAMGHQSLRRQRFPGLDLFCDYFENNYYWEGYLLKEMTVGSLVKPVTEDDPPTLDELQKFQKRKSDTADGSDEENEGSKLASSLLEELSSLQGKASKSGSSNGGLIIGDTVEVIEGDLVGMRGKLVSMENSTVKVEPINTGVDLGGTTEIEFLTNQVRKYIAVGAHVKVMDGRYANETGTVVNVEQLEGESDFTAVVLTDVTNKEISVRTSQLKETSEVATGIDKLSGYELYDLVVLSGGGSANEVGVIVRVGREDFTVINNHGMTREVRPEELRGKRNQSSNKAMSLDVQGNQMRTGDTVNVAEGPHKGKTATIKRMNRAQLFLHSQTRTEHAGIFVVRGRSCVLAGLRAQKSAAAGDPSMTPGFQTPSSVVPRGPVGGRGRKDDSLIGKTVRIQVGQWKGYIGTVSDATATHVQVELHSRLKKVMVAREKVAVAGDKFGATGSTAQSALVGAVTGNPMTMATPHHGPIGGATPAIHGAFGGATPAHGSDNTDEVWRPGGAVDQETVKDDDGWGSPQPEKEEDNDGGWGSSSGNASAWGSQKKEDEVEEEDAKPNIESTRPKTQAIKQQPKSEVDADIEETPVWFMERVCVQLKDSDKLATIKEMKADKSAVVVMEDNSTQIVRAGELKMVPPAEHDMVLVTGGNEIGLEGSLVCVDGSDAILKDANEEFKIIDFVHLVKLKLA